MDKVIEQILGKLGTRPGQGGLFEQIDKLLRKQQREELYQMFETIDMNELDDFIVTIDKIIPQIGKKRPAILRFSLPRWKGYDEIYWQALGDYAILALHRVKDIDYDASRGKITLEYFAKIRGRIKSVDTIRTIIQGIIYLIDNESLPTDYTRFRRMNERRGSLGEMSKEQAAIIGALLKIIKV